MFMMFYNPGRWVAQDCGVVSHMKKYLLLIAFGSLLTACNGEKYVAGPEVSLTPKYKQAVSHRGETIDPTTQWWANYGDATLNRLVEESLAQNLSIEVARERVIAARYQEQIANNTYLPQVDADGSAKLSGTRNRGVLKTVVDRNGNPVKDPVTGKVKTTRINTTTNNSSLSAGLSGSWLIDFLGAKSTAEAQQANIEQQKEALNDARLAVIAAITRTYLTIQGLGREIAIAQKSLAVQNDTARITTAKLDAGTASALDSTRAKGAAALTASDIPVLQQARDTAINNLAVLLAKQPAELNGALTKQRGIKLPRVKFSEGIPADLLRNRPDVRQAEWALKQAVAEIGIAEADLYPTLVLSGNLNVGTVKNDGVLSTQTWGFGPSINIPIFNRGALKANVDLSKSAARIQYLNYRQTVLDAVTDVENAMIALKAEQRRSAQLAIAVDQYGQAEGLARQLNDAGTTEFSDVLDAQSSLYSAQLQYASSALLAAGNYATFCEALGGGWAGYEPVMEEKTN
jgi:multidrug efflux system outer membrane protein